MMMMLHFAKNLILTPLLAPTSVRHCCHKAITIPVAWEKPQAGWTKLNFDGSCQGMNGNSSIGGVVRNDKAEFLLGYAESIGKANSVIAEVTALRRGLELVVENDWTDVWLEGDAKTLVEIIMKKKKGGFRCRRVEKQISDINLIIGELDNCIVTHIYREGNRAADRFAKMGQRLEKPKIWRYLPPKEVMPIVLQDAKGEVVLRRR